MTMVVILIANNNSPNKRYKLSEWIKTQHVSIFVYSDRILALNVGRALNKGPDKML